MANDFKDGMSQEDRAVLLDHDYDGIQELDHPLPRWWLVTFYVTIVFAAFYVGYYLTGIGPSQKEELNAIMAQIEAKRPPESVAGTGDSGVLLASLKDPSAVEKGKGVFVSKCAACHGTEGGGGIGPNLVDDHWIHGQGKPSDVADVIKKGVAEKGMPPWGQILHPDELTGVIAYLRSAHGKNPAGAKAPQGQEFKFEEL